VTQHKEKEGLGCVSSSGLPRAAASLYRCKCFVKRQD